MPNLGKSVEKPPLTLFGDPFRQLTGTPDPTSLVIVRDGTMCCCADVWAHHLVCLETPMTETATLDATPQPGLFARFVGIITSPKATFEAVVRKPRVLGILALTCFIFGASQSVMHFTEKGRQATLDFQVQQMEKMGMTVTDQVYERMVAQQKYAVYMSFIGVFISFPIGLLIMSGILYAVLNAIMGGTAEYKQVMAVCAHSFAISSVGAVFAAAMNLARGSISTSVANLGMLLPMLPERSFAANFAGAIDLFTIWWLVVLSIGLGVLYKRKTSSVATGLFIVYAVIAVGMSYFFASKG